MSASRIVLLRCVALLLWELMEIHIVFFLT